jgi:hypothetical protein
MLKHVLEVLDALDSPAASGETAREMLRQAGWEAVDVETIHSDRGRTDFISIVLPGREGRRSGGSAPTLGIVGCLGSVGARPSVTGMVSDADGAIVAIAVALKLASMHARGDRLRGDLVITTHVSPNAPLAGGAGAGRRRMMPSPVGADAFRNREARHARDAVLSVDATKANRLVNHRGFAISPTVKEGYILPVSDDLLDIMENVTGQAPVTFPLAQQDLVPGRELRHINTIMSPNLATSAPVVGVAITAAVPVPGVATGANQAPDLEAAGRFCIEVAKAFGERSCRFYDPGEFETLLRRYGSMRQFQTSGNAG